MCVFDTERERQRERERETEMAHYRTFRFIIFGIRFPRRARFEMTPENIYNLFISTLSHSLNYSFYGKLISDYDRSVASVIFLVPSSQM